MRWNEWLMTQVISKMICRMIGWLGPGGSHGVEWSIHEQVSWSLHRILWLQCFEDEPTLITPQNLTQPSQATYSNVFDNVKTGCWRPSFRPHVIACNKWQHKAIGAIQLTQNVVRQVPSHMLGVRPLQRQIAGCSAMALARGSKTCGWVSHIESYSCLSESWYHIPGDRLLRIGTYIA